MNKQGKRNQFINDSTFAQKQPNLSISYIQNDVNYLLQVKQEDALTCNYKVLDKELLNLCQKKPRHYFNDYMNLFGLTQEHVKEEHIEAIENDGEQSSHEDLTETSKILSSSPEKYNSHRDNKLTSVLQEDNQKYEDEEDDIDSIQKDAKLFLDQSKQNTYKNIINAFYRHIHNLKDRELQKIYEELTIDKWQYSYISLRVYQNLKKCGRFGLKLKNLLISLNLKKVFLFFLNHAYEFWIRDSKIIEKKPLLRAISIILKAYDHDCDFLVNNICYYRKQKKLSQQ